MKKALTQTIIVFVAVNLITAGFAIAQNAPDEASREEAIAARKQAEVARVEAEIAAKAVQKEAETARKQLEAEQKEMQAIRKQLQARLSQVAEQKEMQAVEKQMQVQLKQLLDAQKQLELQIPEIPEIDVAIPRVSIPAWQHSDGGAVLVIPAAELKVEDLAAITEDMTVMSRIFAKKLSQARLTMGRGSWYVEYVEDYNPFYGRDSGTIEAVYLEGYAALFLMKANFPLSPLPEEKEEKETEEEDTDPLWTQMKREMYAPEEVDRRRRPDDRPEEKYDAEKVEELKETLIKTLKHAANIRALKPDQSVILTVIGGRSQSGTRTTTRSSYGRSSGALYDSSRDSRRSGSSYITTTPRGAESGSFLPTVLTICAKKSDIDDFANGQLSLDQFRERTKIFTSYAKVGQEGFLGVEERLVAKARPPVF